MKLEVAKREREGIAVLDLKGRIIAGDEVSLFRTSVEDAAGGFSHRLVLNLHGVEYIDSSGLGTMVMCQTRLQKSGGTARLVNLNRRNVELLLLTRIDTIFEVFDDEIQAVNAFFPERAIRRFNLREFVQREKAKQS